MHIALAHIGKRYQRNRVFKEVNYTFRSPGQYALLGANGSGKSTLLRIIAGMQSPSAGTVAYTDVAGKILQKEQVFSQVSFCAPGMDLVEELTLREFLDFHFTFRRPLEGLGAAQIIALIGLEQAAGHPIGDFSSGMKQRVKLAQAIFSDTPVLLLDEPCTNLDQKGVEQYQAWVHQYSAGRLVIVASNDEREYGFCGERLALDDFK